MYRIQIPRPARRDIREAAQWYNEQQPGLGRRFTHLVKRKLEFIGSDPYLYEIQYKDARVARVPIFPFNIHFRIDGVKKSVVIFAIFHTSLNPDRLKSRKE